MNFESKSADILPFGVDNSTVLVYLNESDPMVDMTGKLRHPGRYIFVVHYFQPDHPGKFYFLFCLCRKIIQIYNE